MLGFFLLTGVLFSVALYAAGYYVWSVPRQQATNDLGLRLRELRAATRTRSARSPELLRREHRGGIAFLGDLVTWVGVFRRLQETYGFDIVNGNNPKYAHWLTKV